LGDSSPLIQKKTATLVGLEEPRTYIGCRFAGNVGSRFLHRFGGKNAYDLESGRPDPNYFYKIFYYDRVIGKKLYLLVFHFTFTNCLVTSIFFFAILSFFLLCLAMS
jgi:hypothetical protein